MLKSEFIRIAVAGDTTDGRVIEESWLTQMAATYNPEKYSAQINCEHYNSMSPDSSFGNYGQVLALKAEKSKVDGEEKLALFAQLKPNSKLLELNEKGQKLFTSMEVNPNFSNSNTAYLMGLAVTDNPASLGTEMLKFSAGAAVNPFANRKQHKDNVISAATEVSLDFSDAEGNQNKGFVEKITAMFKRQKNNQDASNGGMHQAIEAIANEVVEFESRADEKLSTVTKIENELSEVKSEFKALKLKIETTDFNGKRPPVEGGDGKIQTDY
jgi:hypothetical protein